MAIFKKLSSRRSSSSLGAPLTAPERTDRAAGPSRSSSFTDVSSTSTSSSPGNVASKLFGLRSRAYERFDPTKTAKLQRSKPDLYIRAVQELGEDFMEELPLRQPLVGDSLGKTTGERLYDSRASGKYPLLRQVGCFYLELFGFDCDNIGRRSRLSAL